MQEIFSFISFSNILELPLVVKGPGLLIIALLVFRAITSFFTLRLIKTFSSLIFAFVISVILSQFGGAIVEMLGIENENKAKSDTEIRSTIN